MIKRIKLSVFMFFTGVFTLLNLIILSLSVNPIDDGSQTKKAKRNPANIITSTILNKLKIHKNKIKKQPIMGALHLSCKEKSIRKTLQVHSKYLLIKGKHCRSSYKDKVSETEIINTTNKFKATVFNVSNKKFITDYVYISDGLNELKVSEKYKSGKVISRTYKILKSRYVE